MFQIRKLTLYCCCAFLFLAGAYPQAGAAATAAGPKPVIDGAPSKVGYRAPVDIAGHVEGGPTGVEVTLQRLFPHNDRWKKLDSDRTNDAGEVSFHLSGPRFTGRYRLKTAEAKGNAVTVRVRPDLRLRLSRMKLMENSRLAIEGALRPAMPGRRAKLAWKVNGEWRLLDTVRLGDGHFRKVVRVGEHGRRRVRVTFPRDPHNSWTRSAEVVHVHRRSPATWYGPGFFGNRTACGRRYSRDMLGVAHRTLPCGTMVSALYRGRSVRVPVVDRGPYGDSQWDLTEETAQRLRFSGREKIGVLVER